MVTFPVDPMTGQVVTGPDGKPLLTPIGPPLPSKELVALQGQLKGYGIDPKAPAAAAVMAQLQRAATIGDTKAKDAFLEDLETWVTSMPEALKQAPSGKQQATTGATLPPTPTIAGARAKATAREAQAGAQKIVAETGPKAEQAAQVTAGTERAKIEAKVKPTMAILDRLDELVGKITLPTTGTGRLTEAPGLAGKRLSQQGEGVQIALYESLKGGVLANLVKLFGETGALTEGDLQRANALFPVVVPSAGALPDTQAVAQAKLKQLRGLIEEIAARDSPTKPTAPNTSDAARQPAKPTGTLRRTKSGMLEYVPAGKQ